MIGENEENTIIDGERKGDTIWIKSSFVGISNFTIINSDSPSRAGIFIVEKKEWFPPDFPYLNNISIMNCTLKNNNAGIWLVVVDNVSISSCVIADGESSCILLSGCSNVDITECNLYNNSEYYLGGIFIGPGEDSGLCERIHISNSIIHDNFFAGIRISNAKEIEIYNNTIFQELHGISISDSEVVISNNSIYENGNGGTWEGGIIINWRKKSIKIFFNKIHENNPYGLFLNDADINTVFV